MKGVQFGPSGVVLNGHCLVEGGFDSPTSVLSNVRAAIFVSQGVLVISSKRINGRIGIRQNSIISGAIVDETGENGIAAVYRLLLVPGGRYVFRLPQRTDAWELNQELNLNTLEVEHTLVGPSAIGLAYRPLQFAPPSMPSAERQFHSTTYLEDCQQLLLEERKRRAVDITKKQPTCQSSLPVRSLPKSCSKSEKKVSPAARMCALFALLAVSSFFCVPEKSWAKLTHLDKTVLLTSVTAARMDDSSKDSRPCETAPFILPAGGANSAPPPVPAETNDPAPLYYSSYVSTSGDSEQMEPVADDHSPAQSLNTESASATSNQAAVDAQALDTGSVTNRTDRLRDNVSTWMAKVRSNPNDPSARKYLAYALLYNGNPNASAQQFKALMSIRPLDAFELQSYRDALALRAVPTP